MNRRWLGIAMLGVAAAAQPGWGSGETAEDEPAFRAQSRARGERYPRLSGELSAEIQDDLTYSRQGVSRDDERSELFATVESALSLALSERLSLESALVFEPVEDPERGENRSFDKQGLFAEELYAQLALGALSLRAGKFNPHFGKAWELAPGLYGVDFAEDYELTERVGAGASWALASPALGSHTLSAEAFGADTSPLSRSFVRGRSPLRRRDGGPSNTGNLGSYALALEGEALPGLEQVSYDLGFAYQAAGEGGRVERDYVAGLTYARSAGELVELEFLAEYALRTREQNLQNSGVGLRLSWGLAF